MTTIFRIKRHRKEDPIEALILSCKRKRIEDFEADNDSFDKVLNFSGTVKAKDDNIAKKTVDSFKKEPKYSNLIKAHTPDIKVKQRKEQKERRDDNVNALLNGLRSKRSDEKTEKIRFYDSPDFTIVDFYIDSSDKSFAQNAPDRCYVYDLYSFEDDVDFFDLCMDNMLSLKTVGAEPKNNNGEDESNPDEEDSNDENNPRNDYPDTESSVEEEEDDDLLSKKLKGCRLVSGSEYELSDDTGEDEYLNFDDEEYYHYYEAEDLGGNRYAEYKANILKEIFGDDNEVDGDASSEVEDDPDDSEVLSYDGDSD